MARLGRSLVSALGVLLLLIGGAAALYVGPSDTVRTPAKAVPDGAPVTVLGWRLLGYRDTTLEVTASASTGDVFVGAASPVDTASYTGGARVLDVRAVSPGGALSGDPVGPDGGALKPAPTQVSFWSAKVAGPGEQHLSVPLTGDPVSVVIVASPGAQLTVGLGATVPGAFRAAVIVAVAGLLLLVVAVLLSRRSTRRRRLSASETALAQRREPEAPAPVRVERRALRRRVAPLVVPVGCLVLSGCVSVPQSVAEPSAGPTKVALTSEQAPEVVKDYDARNTALSAEMAKGADEKSWSQVDAGPVYFADVVTTALNRASGTGNDPNAKPWVLSGSSAYAAAFGAYPMWAVVPVTWTRDGSEPVRTVALFERQSVAEPWKMAIDNPQFGDIPAPLPPGTDATAGAADQEAGAQLMTKTAAFLTSGSDPGFPTEDQLTKARQEFLTYGNLTAKLACKPIVIDQRPQDAVRVVRTSAGRLVNVTMRCEQTIFAPQGQTISWKPEFAKAYEATTSQIPTLSRVLYASVTLHQGTDGPVTVIGARISDIRAKDADWAQ